MTFLSPLFLLGLAALAVPILLHLLRRRSGRTLPFPALRYLTRTTREQARIIRLRQLLLLALRMAAVTLFVFAGARLVLPLGGRDHPPAGIALIVDNGLTSGTILGDRRLVDSLIHRGSEVLQRTGTSDKIWIVAAGEPWKAAAPLSSDEARRALLDLHPTHVTSNVPEALNRAAALLETGPGGPSEIVILSDLRPESFPPVVQAETGRPDVVRIAPPPAGIPDNRGVAEVQISGGLAPRAGEPGEILVVLRGSAVSGTAVRGYVEDQLVGSTTAGADGTAILPLPPMPAGWVRGRVETEPDELRGDDAGYFAFPVIPPPPVHVAGGQSPFLEDALGVLDAAARIQSVDADEASVHFLTAGAVPLLSPGDVAVVIPPDDPALLPATNRILEELIPGWRLEAVPVAEGRERQLTGGTLISWIPSRPAVRVAHRIHTDGPGDRIELLSLSDGEPWLIRVATGDRIVLLLSSPLTAEASDLPTSAWMLPLVDLLTTAGAGEPVRSAIRAGEPLPVPSGASAVQLPDGTRRSLDGRGPFLRTEMAGVYDLLAADDEVIAHVAVNARPPEPTPPLTPAEAAGRLSGIWAAAGPAEPWPGTILEGRRGREVSRPLAAVLFLILVWEGWLAASRMGLSRGGAATPREPGPDRMHRD